MLSGLDHSWSRGELILWPLSRLILIPLIVLCAAPHHAPLFPGEWLPISFTAITAILGLTNGLFGNLPIILAPATVRDTSNLMTFSWSHPGVPHVLWAGWDARLSGIALLSSIRGTVFIHSQVKFNFSYFDFQ